MAMWREASKYRRREKKRPSQLGFVCVGGEGGWYCLFVSQSDIIVHFQALPFLDPIVLIDVVVI